MKLGILAVTAMATCLAQGPGAPLSPRFDELKTYLGLTDSQIQSLQQLQTQQGQAMQAIHQEIQQKQTALRDALKAGSTDAAALGRLLLDIENLRKRIEQGQTSYQDQARNVLSETQKTKLKALEEAAKLREEIQEATMLRLLTPPAVGPGVAGGPGMGPGGGGMRGPGGPRPGGLMRPPL